MSAAWKNYQEKTASFFRSLGLYAQTDAVIEGVRTTHAVDVIVKSQHVGFEIVWIIECKYWKTPVSKIHVMGLRQIVADLGADRGILLSESGCQSGAFEAASLTNIHLTSLSDLSVTSENEIYSMKLHELFDRIEKCYAIYWSIPKDTRIADGLRSESYTFGYSCNIKIELVKQILYKSFRGVFPFSIKSIQAHLEDNFPNQFHSKQEVFSFTEAIVVKVEKLLDAANKNL